MRRMFRAGATEQANEQMPILRIFELRRGLSEQP